MSVSDANDYVPIACAFHERLEFAVLRRQRLRIRYQEGEQVVERTALPTDVETRNGAEWLHCQDADGMRWILRLDQIIEAKPI